MNVRFYIKMIPIYILIFSILIFAVFYGNKTIETFSEENYNFSRKIVVIDAGHGGIDGGATSLDGIHESNINLQISLRLNDLLHLLGVKTVMIRKDDRSVYTSGNTIASQKISDLKQRVKIVNESNASVLLSIHQNYFADSRYSGAQVFYCEVGDSKLLANNLQTSISSHLDTKNNRKIQKSSGIYLMDHISITGVLIECGFISNAEESKLLASKQYQLKLSCVLASVVDVHLNS